MRTFYGNKEYFWEAGTFLFWEIYSRKIRIFEGNSGSVGGSVSEAEAEKIFCEHTLVMWSFVWGGEDILSRLHFLWLWRE